MYLLDFHSQPRETKKNTANYNIMRKLCSVIVEKIIWEDRAVYCAPRKVVAKEGGV